MVVDKDSKLGMVSDKDFSEKVKVSKEDIERFSNKKFGFLARDYTLKDVDILYGSLLEVDKLYNKIGYSITDIKSQGIASISHDHGLRYLNGDEFKCFNRKLYDEWKSCYLGGICELHNFNLNKSPIYTYDINGLYSHVRLKYPYPVGEPEEIENPSIDELPNLFGLIKAIVVEDGKVPFGIPRKIGLEFNRVRGRVYYEGTTEELKNYVRLGAVVDKIVKVLHYKERKEGKKQFYLYNSETGEEKISVKGFSKYHLKREDWFNAQKDIEKKIVYWEFKKVDYEEIVKEWKEKKFGNSLKGREYLLDGSSEALTVYGALGIDGDKRMKLSLAGTELDIPRIRLKECPNTKRPTKGKWVELLESESIRDMLKDPMMYNYSLRTGETLGKNIHLVVIDIDLKSDKTYKGIADRFLNIFKKYYTVKTPNEGYHIYIKIESDDKFKSQYLRTLEGQISTIEILGEKKKAIGPGSMIDKRMYKVMNRLEWDQSLSKVVMGRDDFLSKLREGGLELVKKEYVEYDSTEATIITEKDKVRLIDILIGAKEKEEKIKFISLVHGSSSGSPNTLLNDNCRIYCFKCSKMVSFDEYIAYFRRNNSTDRGRICEVGGTSLSRSRSARAKATGARVFQSKAGAIFHIPSVPETTDYDPFD